MHIYYHWTRKHKSQSVDDHDKYEEVSVRSTEINSQKIYIRHIFRDLHWKQLDGEVYRLVQAKSNEVTIHFMQIVLPHHHEDDPKHRRDLILFLVLNSIDIVFWFYFENGQTLFCDLFDVFFRSLKFLFMKIRLVILMFFI